MRLVRQPDKPVVKLFEFNGSIHISPSEVTKNKFFRKSNEYFTGKSEHPLEVRFDQNGPLVKAQVSFIRGGWLKYVAEVYSDGSIKFKHHLDNSVD